MTHSILRRTRVRSAASILIALSPVLGLYGWLTSLGAFTLVDIALFALLPSLIIFRKTCYLANSAQIVLIFCLSFWSFLKLVQVIGGTELEALYLGETARLFFYVAVIVIILKEHFSFVLAIQLWKYVAFIATVVLFFQYLAIFVAGWYPPGVLVGFVLRDMTSHLDNVGSLTWFRPRSIFSEPSGYGTVVGGFILVSSVFQKRVTVSPVLIGFLVAGLLISRSGTAYGLLIIYLLSIITVVNVKYYYWLIASSAAALSAYVLLPINVTLLSLNEFLFRGLRRFAGSTDLVHDQEFILFFVGPNTRADGHWTAAVGSIFNYLGILGVMALVIMLLLGLFRAQNFQHKVYVFACMLMAATTPVFGNNPLTLLFLAFLFIPRSELVSYSPIYNLAVRRS